MTGHVAHVSAIGVFDIHGTSKRETVPLQMSVSDSAIEAVGSLTFPWSEFKMTAPSVGGFVNVTNKATMPGILRRWGARGWLRHVIRRRRGLGICMSYTTSRTRHGRRLAQT
jgi:hypothetical protein